MIFDPSNPPAPAPAASLGLKGELLALAAPAIAFEKRHVRKVWPALVFAMSNPEKVHAGAVAIKTSVLAIGAALVTMFGLQGCSAPGVLSPAAHATVTHIECVAHALRPVLLADAEQAARALEDGQVTLPELLAEVKASEELVKAIKADTEACK